MKTPCHAERHLRAELKRAEARVAELEATVQAIRSGDVDAIVIDGPTGSQIFTLQSPEEPYRILAERMNEGAATLTGEGTVLFCNQRLACMLQVPAERLVGSPFASLLCDPGGFGELLRSAQEQDIRVERRLLRKDRSTLPVVLSLTQIPTEESGPCVCLVATDVSVQKSAEEQVRRLNAELEQRVQRRTAELVAANKELEAFSYAVAHDLRAPLRHIHAFSDILVHDAASVFSEDGHHCLECILKQTTQMERLLEDLLSLSRLGRWAVHRQPVELKNLVEEVIVDLAPEIAERTVEWRVGDLPRAECDAGLVRIVLTNLLSNAVKFTRSRERGVIEVGHRMQDGIPVFFVRDNGVGFDMKYAPKLFGVFQRLHRYEEFEGTGIGLATARRCLQKDGGRIWAEAEVDKGATFYFTLGDTAGIEQPTAAVGVAL